MKPLVRNKHCYDDRYGYDNGSGSNYDDRYDYDNGSGYDNGDSYG